MLGTSWNQVGTSLGPIATWDPVGTSWDPIETSFAHQPWDFATSSGAFVLAHRPSFEAFEHVVDVVPFETFAAVAAFAFEDSRSDSAEDAFAAVAAAATFAVVVVVDAFVVAAALVVAHCYFVAVIALEIVQR